MSAISQTLIDTPTVGLENLQRAAFYVFFESLNNALSEIQTYWQSRDLRFNVVTGRSIPPVALEAVPPENFHEGHKPSLIQGTPDGYPNLSVFAMKADPAPESGRFDQIDSWLDSLLVEIMVKGTDEDMTNRRIQRMAEAVMLCIRRNPTLGGAVPNDSIQDVPSVIISDLFAVRSPSQGGAYKDRFVWQGAQIQYRIQKDSVRPADGAATFSGASETDYSAFIDQG